MAAVRKRSEYRLPSALGVPHYQSEASTAYKSTMVVPETAQATKVKPPDDNLKPLEGTMGQLISENKKRYKPYDIQPMPEKVSHHDNLPMLNDRDDDSPATARSRNDYGSFQDTGRVTPYRQTSRLSLNGDHDFTTDKSESYLSHNFAPPSRNGGPSDNLRPLDGSMAQLKTENQKRYKSYTDLRMPEKVKHDDNLKMNGDLKTDRSSDVYGQYKNYSQVKGERPSTSLRPADGTMSNYKTETQKRYTGYGNPDGEKVTSFKQTGNLTQKGDHDFNMKRNEFSSMEDKSLKLGAPEDHLRPLSGTMYQYKTEVQRWYKPYAYVDHPSKIDAPDHLFPDGELDMQTHKQQEFREYNHKRQGPVKSEDNLKPLQGDMDWQTHKVLEYREFEVSRQQLMRTRDTLTPGKGSFGDHSESRSQFNSKDFERSSQARPSTSMKSKGDHDWNTHKKEAYLHHDTTKRAQPQKYDDNLRSKGLSFEDGTTGRSHYQAHQDVQVPQRYTQADNLKVAGNKARLDDKTTTKLTYQVAGAAPREQPKVPKGSISLNTGPLKGKSESHRHFDAKGNYERQKQLLPAGNIEINKGAEFTQKSNTSNYDYKSGFSNAKPEKVRIGDNLVPNGGIESGTEYKEKFDVVNISKSDLRSKPDWYQTLTTPFGAYAEGQPIRLGNQFNNAISASV